MRRSQELSIQQESQPASQGWVGVPDGNVLATWWGNLSKATCLRVVQRVHGRARPETQVSGSGFSLSPATLSFASPQSHRFAPTFPLLSTPGLAGHVPKVPTAFSQPRQASPRTRTALPRSRSSGRAHLPAGRGVFARCQAATESLEGESAMESGLLAKKTRADQWAKLPLPPDWAGQINWADPRPQGLAPSA